jgi:hypothetical protein
MTRVLSSRDYLKKCLSFLSLIVLLSLGAIGGCSGSSNPELAVVGEHRDVALSGISSEIQTSQYDGVPTNLLMDGVNINNLSNDEIASIRDAYNAGFVIVFYDVSDRDIVQIYQDIIESNVYSDVKSLKSIPEGNTTPVFAIEQINGVVWSFSGNFNATDASKLRGDSPDEMGDFALQGRMIRDWLNDIPSRDQVIDAKSSTASRLVDNAGLRSKLDAQLGINKSDEPADLSSLTYANINTHRYTLQDSKGNENVYQTTQKAWILTADTPTGIFSFLLVEQDFNLQSSALFIYNKVGHHALNAVDPSLNPDQGFYLKEFKVENSYFAGGNVLIYGQADLLDESPATNQASIETTTTSLTTSIQGSVQVGAGAKPDSGAGNVQFQFGIQWGTSTTVSKENVSINNLSLTSKYGNDATWQFLPRRPEIGGSSGGQAGSCQNYGLRNLADLAHTTFQPATAFIVRLSPDHVGQTLEIRSDFTYDLERSQLPFDLAYCDIFGCNCRKIKTSEFQGVPHLDYSYQAMQIPLPPE